MKLQDDFSDWLAINGGVPQGTKLGPILFLVMINDLRLAMPTMKYVDDTTIFETIPRNSVSYLQTQADALSSWCESNGAKVNSKKTLELRIDFSKLDRELDPIIINNSFISIVLSTKLLGLMVSDDLSINTQYVCNRASRRLHFLVNLRRTGLNR